MSVKSPASPAKTTNPSSGPNEGEGNRTAAREFNAEERKFVASGQVEKKAREAQEAFDGKEGDELRRAEELGKSHSKGEDPKLKR
jgi:hypothetical protein